VRPAMMVAALLLLVGACQAQVVDQEYQKWAAKQHQDKMLDPERNTQHKEMIEKGRSLACGICNVMVQTVMDRYQKGLEGKLKNGFREEDSLKILDAMCEYIAPNMAKSMDVYKEDAKMNCKRVINEHASDLLDMISIGEDPDLFCKDEVKVCDMGHKHMMYATYKMAAMQKAKAEAKKAAESQDEIEYDDKDEV